MPTSDVTVTDQASGAEIATHTITEDSKTKHIQRVAIDSRLNSPPKRYSVVLAPLQGTTAITTVRTNIAGVSAGANAAYIWRIQSIQANIVAGTYVPIAVFRATSVAGGTQITAANIPRRITTVADPTLVCRHGAVTGTEAAERLLLLAPLGTVGAAGSGSTSSLFEAQSIDECIVLATNEGLIFEVEIASDTDNRYWIIVDWEEA